jgi:hypothetical protein
VPLVAGGRLLVAALQSPYPAKSAVGDRLAVAVADITEAGNGFLQVADGIIVAAQSRLRITHVDQGESLARPVACLPEQGQRLPEVVSGPLVSIPK